jgi:hypothetical protein
LIEKPVNIPAIKLQFLFDADLSFDVGLTGFEMADIDRIIR